MSRSTQIKICGIKAAATLEFTIEAGANLVGFVNFSKSPRHVEIEQIAKLIELTPQNISSVVLLVNPDFERVKEFSALKPDFIQLHGNETPQFINRINKELGQKILKALPVGGPKDLGTIDLFASSHAHILLDAKPPKDATRPGGLGETFDWNLLDKINPEQDYFLSGGLNCDNVYGAIEQLRPLGVDVSSGVESSPGQKDARLITKFITNVRLADKNHALAQ